MTPERLYEVLDAYAKTAGHELNRDRQYVMEIIDGLLKNQARYTYRSCPCRLATGFREKDRDIFCPCAYKAADIRDYGSCYCYLYVSRDWNEGKMEHVRVPERRPREMRT